MNFVSIIYKKLRNKVIKLWIIFVRNMLRIFRQINQIFSLILALSVVAKASPSIRDQKTNQYNTIIQNYYNEITENEITDDAFEGYESEKEAVLGEPDKSINIVEDDIATDLEEVTGFFISAQILFFLL